MFKVGDLVDMKGRKLNYYGKVVELKGEEAVVNLRFRNEPEGGPSGVCKGCGWPGGFSVNGGTGEIVCMRSGCGYEYGFKTTKEIIPISELINMTDKKYEEAKKKFISEAKKMLDKADREGLLDKQDKEGILKILETLHLKAA